MRPISRRSPLKCARALFLAIPLTIVALVAASSGTIATVAAQGQAGVWEPLGPSAGTVFAIESDPFDARVMIAGSYFGGLYRSADHGVTWTHLPTPFSSRLVLGLAHAPGRNGTLYAGTFQDGLYRSLDGGATWTKRSTGLPEPHVQAVAISSRSG
jgi:photosystem II stability/assembly factor-like uncharacterized protein